MESLVLLLVVGFVVVGWMALRRIEGLQTRIATLERKTEFLLNRHNKTVSEPTAQTVTATPKPVAAPLAARAPAPSKTAPKPSPRQPLPPPVKKPAKPKLAPKPKLDLETLLGAKGSVWIGGLALLFGAVFLLRYTIEAGMLTPLMRISIAILMGLLALGLSEGLARRDLKTPVGQALAAKADIPAILAAVGVFTLFGAVYAAHALYGLLGTLAAFVLMAAIAVGAMGLSLRRGPWLAAIGLIGALVVPLLVASVTPSYLGVVAYVTIITGAALWVATRQNWPWLRAAALIGATAWLAILLGKAVDGVQFGLWAAGLAGSLALVLKSLSQSPVQWKRWTPVGWGGVIVLMSLSSAASDDLPAVSNSLPFLVSVALLLFAVTGDVRKRWPALFIGGVVINFHTVPFMVPWGLRLDLPWQYIIGALSVAVAFASLRVGARWVNDQRSTILTFLGGALAVALMVSGFADLHARPVPPIVWSCFALAGLFAVATWTQPRLSVARAAAWIAVLAWVIGAAQIDVLWQSSFVLSLGVAAMISLALRRDDLWVRLTPFAMAGVAGLTAIAALEGSVAYGGGLVVSNGASNISTTPFLNALWLYFGLPGAIAAVGAILLRRRREDLASQALLGGGIVFTLLLIVLLIHHAMNGGNLTATPGFEDYAVQLLVAFAGLFGASWLRGGLTDWPKAGRELWRFIVPTLAMGVSGLSLLIFVVAQLFTFNPLMNVDTVINGHPVFNSLLLGYLAPALLLGGAALRFSGLRPVWFVRALGALAGVSWLVWTMAQIRRVAQGEVMALDRIAWDNGELYAVSAIWLLTGIVLLLAGLKTGRRDLRLASAGLITVTSLKVFLIDMAALDGALRAVSFIGLGIVLIGIGRVYQTVLTRPSRATSFEVDEMESL